MNTDIVIVGAAGGHLHRPIEMISPGKQKAYTIVEKGTAD